MFEIFIKIFTFIICAYFIKKNIYKINIVSSIKLYFEAVSSIKSIDFKNLEKSKTYLDRVSKYGLILILKISIISLPFIFFSIILNIFGYPIFFILFIPLLPYIVLFKK